MSTEHSGFVLVFWLLMGTGFLVLLAGMMVLARRLDRVEDDTRYLREEHLFTPYGQKYLDLLLFRGDDD